MNTQPYANQNKPRYRMGQCREKQRPTLHWSYRDGWTRGLPAQGS